MVAREIEGRVLAPLVTFRDTSIADKFTDTERQKVEGAVRKLLRINDENVFVGTAMSMLENCQKFWEAGDPGLQTAKDPLRSLALARMRTSLRRAAEVRIDEIESEELTMAIDAIRQQLKDFVAQAETIEELEKYSDDDLGREPEDVSTRGQRRKKGVSTQGERRVKDGYKNTSGTSGRHRRGGISGRFPH